MYTILNNNLQVKGKLTLDNGQGSTAFFGDAITQQIATDNSTDPNNLTTQAFNETDKQGNSKSWGHSLTLSVENTALGSSITTADSILYLDNVSNKYYLMKIIDISGDRNSGFRTINAVNTAVYELGKKLFNTEKTYTKASLADVVNDVYKDVPFSLRIEDDLETVIDYTISAGTSAQAIFQDLQTKYDVDIDSWVELDNSGNLSERVLYFGHLGTDNGELIRYGGTKGFENITAQEVSDTIYTKLWVNGQTDDKNPNNGHIGSVNNGLEYIVDDDANANEYPIGANQQQPAYLEGIITNNLLSEPQALLDWSQIQMSIFNHARFNYTVTPLHDQVVGIGDIVAVQDFHMQPMILVTSKVIQKVTSFASPETNTFVLGEFSNIFTKQLNKNSNVITLIKKDVTVVQEAADNARVAADEAHKQAVIAQSKAIKAQTSADGKVMSLTVASVEDLPVKANEGDIAWVTLEDGTHGYTFINGHWIEDINPNLKKSIQDSVTTAVSQAKSHVEEVKQGLSSDIATAKSQAASLASTAEANAKSEATSQFNQAKDALAEAKTNLQNDIDESKGNIVEINETLTGFDGTLQRVQDAVNGLGQTNQLMNTEFSPDFEGWVINSPRGSYTLKNNMNYNGSTIFEFDARDHGGVAEQGSVWLISNEIPINYGSKISLGVVARTIFEPADGTTSYFVAQVRFTLSDGTTTFDGAAIRFSVGDNNTSFVYGKSENIAIPNNAVSVAFYSWVRGLGTVVRLSQPMIVFESTVGQYVQGNYNNNGALAQVKLTADEASAAVTKLTNADGIITKAQADIKANADAITQKVSQTVYDKNTGDLTQAISRAQTTADGAVSTVGNYQTSNDERVKAAESAISQNAKDITAKVSQTDYDNNNSQLNTRFTKVEATADGASTTVGKLQTDFNGMSYENRNLLENSGFEFPVNNITGTFSIVDGSNTTMPTPFDTKMGLIDNVANQVAKDVWGWYPLNTAVTLKANVTYTLSYYFSVAGKAGYQHSDYGVDDSGNFIKDIMAEHETPDTTGGQMVWKRYSKTFTLTTDKVLAGLRFGFVSNVDDRGWKVVDNVKLEIGSKATDYSVAPHDTTLSISQVSQKADSISNFVRDSSGNISSNFQTALSRTSIITGSTLASSIKVQTATQISSALTDNNKNIIAMINLDKSGVQIYGKNIVLDGDTTVAGTFKVSQANIANGAIGTAQIGDASITSAKIANLDVSKLTGDTITGFNFNVNRSLNIASGGVIKSDIVNMTKTDFMLKTNSIANSRTSATGYRVDQLGQFNIDTMLGGMYSQGTITIFPPNSNTPERTGNFLTQYNTNNIYLSALNYSNKAPNEYMNISSAHISIIKGGDGLQANATDYAYLNATLFSTTGSVQTGGTVSSKHIMLNDTHGIVMLDNIDLYLLGANGNPVGMHGKSWSNSSLRSMKEHFSNVDPKYALDEVLKTDIKSYNFIGDDITDNYVSPIIDDTKGEFYIPKDFIDSTGKGVKTYSIDGYLIQSIKALQEQITELKQG